MIGEEGYYVIYRRMINHGHVEKKFLGRFVIDNGILEVVEDSDGELHKVLPPGPFDDLHLHRLEGLELSPYFMVYHESELPNGTQDSGKDAEIPTA